MKLLLSILLLSAAMQAQNFAVNSFALPDAPHQHPFLTLENKVGFGILAGLITADAITTQRGLSESARAAQTIPGKRPMETGRAP